VKRFAEDAARVGCRVEVAAPPSLVGKWDPVRLPQIVTNLLTNALNFGAGKPIRLTVEASDDFARLVVADQGDGIASEDIERIFGRYEQAVASPTLGGMGLGLYIVRELVSAHGGTVRVESAPGRGSTFTVELPRQPEARARGNGPTELEAGVPWSEARPGTGR
jgi:signal transduction histidine kinase